MKLVRDYKATMELPIDEAFETAVTLYTSHGYEEKASDPPMNASFVGYKGSAFGKFNFNKRARSRQKTVQLSFTSTSNDRTTVMCKYTMPMSTGSGDWGKVLEEVEALEKVSTKHPQHPEVDD